MTQQQNDTHNGQEIQPQLQLEGGPRQLYLEGDFGFEDAPNPAREEYKADHDASEGDVLKFQAFYLSWKNISHNLWTLNQVIQSTGACCDAAAKGATSPAIASGIQLASGGEWGHAKTPGSYKKTPVKGILEASGDLYWPTISSY